MTDTDTNNELTFHDWHKPGILPGEYTIQVKQTIVADLIPSDDPGFATEELSFAVLGERFVLAPKEVHAVFPPDGSMGDHSNVLPHVVLRRSTLPWERQADENDASTPWLALLVFHDGEILEPQSKRLGDTFKDIELQRGQSLDDKVTVIEVKKDLLKSIVPDAGELKKLTHVRKRVDVELAVVIANRLPKPSGFTTAHLVSLEHRFKEGKFDFGKNEDVIPLISLASFRFGCFEPKQSFSELLRALHKPAPSPDDNRSSTLRLPDYPSLEELTTGSHQESAKTVARKYLASGAVPLRYRLRTGQTAVSWYHGPLAPAKSPDSATTPLPVHVADELVRYSSRTGMFDVSYAAAWEIGRLLALQNKNFSLALHNWKREHAKLDQQADPIHVHPLDNPTEPEDLPLPKPVGTWLEELALFEGVPFSYLVPDERMLPLESIRFFWLDHFWIECLRDGAFSIGRHTGSDKDRDAAHLMRKCFSPQHPCVTGLILRSEVVSGWPGLQVDGYDNDKPLTSLRMVRLSPNVLLCLFEGEITKVTFHQKMETLHFGLQKDKDGFFKALRQKDKRRSGDEQKVKVGLNEKRILDVKSIKTATSADFAYQMIERLEEVTFSISQFVDTVSGTSG